MLIIKSRSTKSPAPDSFLSVLEIRLDDEYWMQALSSVL